MDQVQLYVESGLIVEARTQASDFILEGSQQGTV